MSKLSKKKKEEPKGSTSLEQARYFFNPLIVRKVFQELADRFPQNRMHKVRSDLGKGNESELTFVETWMRDLQQGFPDLSLAVKQDVKIDDPRSPAEGFSASESFLDRFQFLKKQKGFKIGLYLNHSVHKPILIRIAKG